MSGLFRTVFNLHLATTIGGVVAGVNDNRRYVTEIFGSKVPQFGVAEKSDMLETAIGKGVVFGVSLPFKTIQMLTK